MYSPHQQDIKREYKASGTLSPPPDPTCIPIPGNNDGISSPNNHNHNHNHNNNNQLNNQISYIIRSHQQDGKDGPESTPQPSRLSLAYSQVNNGRQQQQQQQQQPWFGSMMDNNTFSPTSPNLLSRDLLVSPSTSTTQTESMYHTGDDDDTQQRHVQDMFDKRRRRRESHNMVERRRRDNINERIQDLCSLLPNHLINASPVNFAAGTQRSPSMINKGTILKLSVDHIKELRDQAIHYQQRIRELEQIIHHEKFIHQPTSHQQHFYNLQQQLPSFSHEGAPPLPIQSLQPLDTISKDNHNHNHDHNHYPLHPLHHPHDIRPSSFPSFGALTGNTF